MFFCHCCIVMVNSATVLQTEVSIVRWNLVFVDGHVLDVKWRQTAFSSVENCVRCVMWTSELHTLMARNIDFMFRSCIRYLKYIMCVSGQWYQVSSAEPSAPTPALPTFHDQASTHNVLGCSSSLDLYTVMRPHYDDMCKFVFSVCTVPKIIAPQMHMFVFSNNNSAKIWYSRQIQVFNICLNTGR